MAREKTNQRERDWGVPLSQAVMIASVAFLFGLLAGQALSHDGEVSAVGEPRPVFAAAPELPREWALEREAVTFDHMFRKGPSAVE